MPQVREDEESTGRNIQVGSDHTEYLGGEHNVPQDHDPEGQEVPAPAGYFITQST